MKTQTLHPNPIQCAGRHIRQSTLALALSALAGFSIHAQAQNIIHVGGEGAVGDSALTITAGLAFVPNAGGMWAAASGENVSYSRLTSPTLTVPTSGTVTLSFNHRYNFEDDWDGGAVYVSVNGGTPSYLPLDALNGYVKVLSSTDYPGPTPGPFPDHESVFTGLSADWGTPAYLTSTATLGPFNVNDTIAFEFRAGWDWGYAEAAPNWEISSIQVEDSASTELLNTNFVADGASGFTVASDAGVTGPWAYAGTDINQFEIDANSQTADRYVPSSPGIIDLNGAKLKVVLLNGTLEAGKTFSLFDLSGGSSIQGSYSSIELPPVQWDLTGLQPGGNGQIVALSGPVWTYTWNNTTPGTYDWETANWDYTPTDPAPAAVWPDGAATVAYLNPPAGSNTHVWTMTANSTTLGELHFGAVSGARQTINGLTETLVFDNGALNAKLTRGDVSTQIEANMNFGAITLDSDLDIDITSHITSGFTINAPIGGPGGLNVYNVVGDAQWPGLTITGTHTYAGGTTLTNGTLTLPGGSSVLNGISLANGTLRLGYNGTLKSQSDVLGGAISGSGTVMTEGNITFDNDANSWAGALRTFGNFPAAIQFTSIGNVGETIIVNEIEVPRPTALGSPTTVAEGTILGTGGTPNFAYIGSGDTTDRIFQYAGFGDGDWGLTVSASGTTTPQSPFVITSNLAGGGMGRMTLEGTGAGEWAGDIGTTANRLRKLGSGTWKLSGNMSYTGATTVDVGSLILDGTSTGGGLVTVASDARLGGNGSTSSAVTVNSGGKLLAIVTDWSAGTCSSLEVASLSLPASWAVDVTIDAFTETSKTFQFLTASGGITGFTAPTVNGPGTGTWLVRQNESDATILELVYTVSLTNDYDTWAGPSGYNLTGDQNADDDGDGLSNFQEFAFGLDPTSGASVNPITDLSSLKSNGTFSYTRRDPLLSGLNYTVWISYDLQGWGTEPVAVNEEAGLPDAKGVQTVIVELLSMPVGDKVFLRVKADY